jgi:protein-S-isoprenylcysteine O-methyltransferase Ste14
MPYGRPIADPVGKGLRVRVLIVMAAAGMLAACAVMPARPGRLSLSNFAFDRAEVETIVTSGPYCAVRTPGYIAAARFTLPLNGTRVIDTPPGAGVCWRHSAETGGWSGWSRISPTPGETTDATL